MKLIICAHKNEASSFFHYHKCIESASYKNLYVMDNDSFILITGEGLWDAITVTMQALYFLKSENFIIDEMINLGIVGSLRPHLQKFELFQIRTSYCNSGDDLCEFHSYSSSHSDNPQISTTIDCISSYKRLVTVQEKSLLSPIAHVVDRELWSIAKVASMLSIPWSSYKLVSDEYNDENFCNTVQDSSLKFSSMLYESYANILKNKNTSLNFTEEYLISNEHQILECLHSKSLHLTFSQKHIVIDYITRILKQENISLLHLFNLVPFDDWHILRPKDKTQMLIQWLKLRLTPHIGTKTNLIMNWINEIQKGHKNLQLNLVDQCEALEVKFKSFNEDDWGKLINTLQKVNRSELENIFKSSST